MEHEGGWRGQRTHCAGKSSTVCSSRLIRLNRSHSIDTNISWHYRKWHDDSSLECIHTGKTCWQSRGHTTLGSGKSHWRWWRRFSDLRNLRSSERQKPKEERLCVHSREYFRELESAKEWNPGVSKSLLGGMQELTYILPHLHLSTPSIQSPSRQTNTVTSTPHHHRQWHSQKYQGRLSQFTHPRHKPTPIPFHRTYPSLHSLYLNKHSGTSRRANHSTILMPMFASHVLAITLQKPATTLYPAIHNQSARNVRLAKYRFGKVEYGVVASSRVPDITGRASDGEVVGVTTRLG